MQKNSYIAILVVGVLMGAVGFVGGKTYQEAQTPKMGQFMQQRNGEGQRGGNNQEMGQRVQMRSGGITAGEVVSLEDQTLTLKMADGSSKIVVLSDSTSYQKTDSATKTDLGTGSKVTVIGESNTDGSLTAKTVMLGENSFTPPMGAFQGGNAPGSGPIQPGK